MTEKIDMDEKVKILAGQLPGVMGAVHGLHSEVVKDGALSARTKELMMWQSQFPSAVSTVSGSMFLKQ